MILSMSGQARLFLLTIMAGFALGFLYDIFRIFRKSVKHSNLATNIEDFIYWLLVSLSMFYFMLDKNYGDIRFFNIIGAFTGMGLYFITISRLVLKVSLTVIEFFKKVILSMVKIILLPIKLLIRILKIPLSALYHLAIKIVNPGKKVLQKSNRYVKIKGRKVKNDIRIIFKKI